MSIGDARVWGGRRSGCTVCVPPTETNPVEEGVSYTYTLPTAPASQGLHIETAYAALVTPMYTIHRYNYTIHDNSTVARR
jgi:hypothetical protein